MTRFARAKGSKASNERLPERATPWSMMRNQPQQDDRQEDASEREKFEAMRKQNYENFLKEQAAEKTVKTWCAFEESAQTKNSNSVDSTNIKNSGKSKKKKRNVDFETSSSEKTKEKHSDENESSEGNEEEIDKWLNENPDEETETKYTDITTQLENILKSKKTNKKNKSKDNSNSESSFTVTNAIENDDSKIVKKSKKRKCDEASVDDETSNHAEIPKKINKTADAQDVSENKNKKSKNKTKTAIPEELGIENTKNISDNSNESNRNRKKNKKVNNVDESSKIDKKLQSDVTLENAEKNTNKKQKKSKTKNNTAPDEKNESKIVQKLDNKSNMASNNKNKKDFESKRRKPQMEKSILIVNGEQLEVSCFDGFPILTKDAERLQDLRKNLISKGIPRSEVTRTMKLERRKAEKALSRMKKKLCFHCRKGGHNLSECPELTQKSDFGAPSTGICFKCGSTEHTHFACKVVRTQDYKFAQCFICKEQGHISRQCPDNPRGLYPKGGGCRECGDVTHLKKDCPKIVQQKEDTSIKLDLMDHENIEDNKKSAQQVQNSSIKRIKF